MKKYTDGKSVWAFEADGSQDKFINAGLSLITEAQAQAILNPAPTLAQAQGAQIALISAACGSAIIAGMPSSVLGSSYVYPTTDLDQARMNTSVNLSNLPGNSSTWSIPIKCQNSAGEWVRVSHTANQLQRVAQDISIPIIAMLVKNDKLSAQIMAATTVSLVQTINWS